MLVHAINVRTLLPKAIILIFDNEITKLAKDETFGYTIIIGTALNWLVNEIRKLISGYKDKLPNKAKKTDFPAILWAESPTHKSFEDNFQRKRFNSCLS